MRGLLEAHLHLEETRRRQSMCDMRAAFWASAEDFGALMSPASTDGAHNGDITNL